MNIINVGYDSTNYYALETKTGKLLVDCGWPGTLPKLSAELKRKGSALKEIKNLLVTHFHPDHAGLVQELAGQGFRGPAILGPGGEGGFEKVILALPA